MVSLISTDFSQLEATKMDTKAVLVAGITPENSRGDARYFHGRALVHILVATRATRLINT